MTIAFPKDFLWGTASSCLQIEGAAREGGRGPTVWDTFCATPGCVENGDTLDIACDHYHRYPEDIALMRRLGVGAYRYSIAWTRIQPTGKGPANPEGVAFYDRLTDAVLEAGIQPWICLHHWDLPQRLEDQGGWRNRDTSLRFQEFSAIMAESLGDRVKHWAPINEPNVLTHVGYGMGVHAPGKRSRADIFAAIHHINLAYGLSMQVLREIVTDGQLGPIIALTPVLPKDPDSAADREAAEIADWMWRRVMTDAVMLGTYPERFAEEMMPHIQPGDLGTINQPLDYFGLNHYSKIYIEPDPDHSFGYTETKPPEGVPLTAFHWHIDPGTIREQLDDMAARYPNLPPVYITENGAAFDDVADAEGRVQDQDRIDFFRGYLTAVAEAIQAGHDVRGYFVWSLMDNFEWAAGYDKRFGIVRVDYDTLKRIPKASFDYLAERIDANAVDA